MPDPSSAVLQPGETRVFEVAFEVSSPGSYRSEITIGSSGAKPITIPVLSNTLTQTGGAKKIPTEALRSAMQPTVHRLCEARASHRDQARRSKKLRILRAGSRVFEFAWERPEPDPVAWVVQQRHPGN